MSRRSAVASSRLSKNGSLLKCSGTLLAESTLFSLCSRATRGRRHCVPPAAPYVRAAPQGKCSADTGAVGLALNPLPRKRFPAGDQMRLDGATTTRPAACGDPASQPADTSACESHRATKRMCERYELRGPTGLPATGCGLGSSTPNCTTGCCVRSLPPTRHPHHYQYEKPYAPSTFTSPKPSTTPGC
jgi:hypothetical protein